MGIAELSKLNVEYSNHTSHIPHNMLKPIRKETNFKMALSYCRRSRDDIVIYSQYLNSIISRNKA